MNYFLNITFFLVLLSNVNGQQIQSYFLDYKHDNNIVTVNDLCSHYLDFEFQLPSNHSFLDLTIVNSIFVACDSLEIEFIKKLNVDSIPDLRYKTGTERKKFIVRGDIFPFVFKDEIYQKLIFVELHLKSNLLTNYKKSSSVESSILSSGEWFNFRSNSDGIYRLSFQDLESLGMDVSNLDPRNLRIFGHPAGMLPSNNSSERPNDLIELAIEVVGQSDGIFDENDYVLFFGQSPHQWILNNNLFSRQQHYYDDYCYYFISSDHGLGKRVDSFQSLFSADTTVNTFNDFQIHEIDNINLIKSGRNWFGEVFNNNDSKSYNFAFPNLTGNINIKIALASNTPSPYNSQFNISGAGMSTETILINGVSGSYNKANLSYFEKNINPISENIQLTIEHVTSSTSSSAWLDFIEINAERDLKMSNEQMLFRSISSVKSNSVSEFLLSNVSPLTRIWDVTFPLSPKSIKGNNSAYEFSFKISTDTLRNFIAFDGDYLSVNLLGKVENQDLHAIKNIDYLIVSHPTFFEQANRLANFHRNNGLTVEVVNPQQIYNEFSSGSQDVSAIRDFAKMLYEQESPLKYLLLFGDASYDPKNRLPNNTNYIVSYQSENSTNELYSYVSDDYFALLDNEENIISDNPNTPFLDIGVGRFPVQTLEEAKIAVDKVINYSALESFGDWRLNICFVGDDNDESETVHSLQAEQLADYISTNYPIMNVDKIYLDAYEQESSTGGQRCESVNNAISDAINKGVFLVNYTGHGGELGWAHERILEIDDINSWNNKYRLPLFMTATCEFSRYDDPQRESAGEAVFLKENGGAIALFTTSRVVFTNSNLELNSSLFENLFPDSNDPQRLGDVLIKTKNNVNNISNTNHRNFTLLGDPALKLAYPQYEIVLNHIDDTAKALGLVNISGEIQQNGVKLENFNGIVYPKVFDKRREYQTLGQDESPIFIFDLQKNILFRGKSSVQNGEFTFSFIVPKDINYNYGNGKISLYATGHNQNKFCDAFGFDQNMIIGGTSTDFIEDFSGPQIKIFMNDTNFVSGGITDANPSLYALLFDESGINTTGNGIGHNMLAVLDEATANPIVLNDFYESDINSYKSGIIEYPFFELGEGNHNLKVKVWDVQNNSSEEDIQFFVTSSSDLIIQNLLNYPNPVVDFTSFYFEHNQSNEPMKVILQIIDLNGRIVKEIRESVEPSGYRYGPIQWSGNSENGSNLSPGIYIYSLTARLSNGKKASNSGKLILTH